MSAFVFGPVPSRRLGRSLGVDLVPFKTCPYDCIYCQLGRTTNKTVQRREWVPLGQVLCDIEARLDSQPDYITLSGSGEPTLYSRIDELIAGIKQLTTTPVAVLTNGALLSDPSVRRSLRAADVIAPSLDAPDAALFQHVNRPHPSVHFEEMLRGLVALRQEYAGQIWLEIFLIAGVTAVEPEAARLAALAQCIAPDRVQLNTATRPTAESYVAAVDGQRMQELAMLFGERAAVIADLPPVARPADAAVKGDHVRDLLARRPCTAADVAQGLGIHQNEALKYLGELLEAGEAEALRREGRTFFRLTPTRGRSTERRGP
jgi:wyosine [tRNA(Phe)-imidazoG37] synthetase (radical SAM superfamily)